MIGHQVYLNPTYYRQLLTEDSITFQEKQLNIMIQGNPTEITAETVERALEVCKIKRQVKHVELTNSMAPEPQGSTPHSQEPANDSYPESGESTAHPPNQSP
jgi:hypothetical protein